MLALLATAVLAADKPNFLFLWADDLGWGDLGCYGHPTSDTPNLDKLCHEGKKFMSIYTSSPVCSPSRAGLLTGRYQTRSGVYPGVFWPQSVLGLPLNETTIAEVLRDQGGYDTAMVGKWHLGVGMNFEYLPTEQGFNRWMGAPYSHDMPDPTYCYASTDMGDVPGLECYVSPTAGTQPEPMHTTTPIGEEFGSGARKLHASSEVQVPLFNGTKENIAILAQPLNLTILDEQYTTAAVDFINGIGRTQGNPWFLYYAFQHTHHPDYASSVFFNTTARGMMGDALKALDWSAGKVLDAVRETGQEENTFVFFSADNGPSLTRLQRGGDAGPLRCGKGTTWEGGQRVPGIIKWPAKIVPGVAREIASTLDLFATVLDITGLPMPSDRTYDSHSMLPFLVPNSSVEAGPVRDYYYYWDSNVKTEKNLNAIRWREWKAHYQTGGSHCPKDYFVPTCADGYSSGPLDPPMLFNLNHDPGEHVPLNASDPTFKYVMETIAQLKADILASPGLFGASAIPVSNPMAQPCVHAQTCKASNQSSNLGQCCRTVPY